MKTMANSACNEAAKKKWAKPEMKNLAISNDLGGVTDGTGLQASGPG